MSHHDEPPPSYEDIVTNDFPEDVVPENVLSEPDNDDSSDSSSSTEVPIVQSSYNTRQFRKLSIDEQIDRIQDMFCKVCGIILMFLASYGFTKEWVNSQLQRQYRILIYSLTDFWYVTFLCVTIIHMIRIFWF